MEQHLEVLIPAEGADLEGFLGVPLEAAGVVLFAHGSGSSRFSSRNRQVAAVLREEGFATLLTDLLTEAAGRDRSMVFDVDLIARRLTAITAWADERSELNALPTGYFGASTGAAAAIRAAARAGSRIGAVVSRGGRPDLAHPDERVLTAPTLLIVGSLDGVVLDLNRRAFEAMTCTKQLSVVPGAGHLFEEPGALEHVGQLATEWFRRHLVEPTPAA